MYIVVELFQADLKVMAVYFFNCCFDTSVLYFQFEDTQIDTHIECSLLFDQNKFLAL